MINYSQPTITDDDIAAVTAVLKGTMLTGGPWVNEFEKEFCQYIGCKHAISVSSGTAGLHIASLVLELMPGDAVFVPCNTFAATINSILYTGATPIISDIDIHTGNICPESLKRCIAIAKKEGLKPKSIYLVHFAGHPARMTEIMHIARKEGLNIVEDSCHALGAELTIDAENKLFSHCGTQGDMAVWSFHPTKHITTGEGGMLTTNSDELAAKAQLLRSHGLRRMQVTADSYPGVYDIASLGYNYRMSDMNAALGLSQLKRIRQTVAAHREIAHRYHHLLAGIPHILVPGRPESSTHRHAYHLFPILIDFDMIGRSRREVMQELYKAGINTQVHYIPLNRFSLYQSMNIKSDKIVNGSMFFDKVISLPMHNGVSLYDVDNIVSILKSVTQCQN